MKKINFFKKGQISDARLLLTITIGIFVLMYVSAIIFLGGGFTHAQQIFDMLNYNSSFIIVACGLTIVMIGGGIDISVGAVTSLVVMACIKYLNPVYSETGEKLSGEGNIFAALLIALGIGLAFGLVQGFLISYLEIQPFIVTLAGMFFARGMTTIISIKPMKIEHESFSKIMDARIEIPWLGYTARNGNTIPARVEYGVVIALIVLIVVFLILKYMRLGRCFYAIGGNQQSALMLGINVKKTRFLSYVICGLLSGISGFVLMMHSGSANATNAQGMEMSAIAASIIGGTLLTGGVGNVAGTFFGVLTLTTITQIVVSSGFNDLALQNVTIGGMLGFFIILQSIILTRRNRKKTG